MRNDSERERYKKNPIWETDFSKPMSEIVEGIRNDLTRARGKLHDIDFGTHWGEHVEPAVGSLTCAIAYLHSVVQDMKRVEEKNS
jgi:hypothetical protein